MYKIIYTKQAAKDIPNLKSSHLDKKALTLIEILKNNPYRESPPYEKLVGDLQGLYSRRINIKHRLVYEVFEDEKIVKIVKIVSLWSHYENI